MSDNEANISVEAIHSIFSQLNPNDVEQFYASYQEWALQQEISNVQLRIETLQQQIAENDERKQRVQPGTIALASLARLQSNGVTDIDLLDRMLECGETWLDQTMQRLEYCEHSELIGNDYTTWCENALEGAFNWIDSMQEASNNEETTAFTSTTTTANEPSDVGDALTGASVGKIPGVTEEQVLQKLMSEDIDEAFLLEPTLKIAAVSPRKAVEDAFPPLDGDENMAEDMHSIQHIDQLTEMEAPAVSALSIEETPTIETEAIATTFPNASPELEEAMLAEPVVEELVVFASSDEIEETGEIDRSEDGQPEFLQSTDVEEQPLKTDVVEFPDLKENPREPDEIPSVTSNVSASEESIPEAIGYREVVEVQEPRQKVWAPPHPRPGRKKPSFWQRLFGRFGWK